MAREYCNADSEDIDNITETEIISPSLLSGDSIMDEPATELVRKLTDQIEKFLKACRAEGDITIEDVLKRLEELKKET